MKTKYIIFDLDDTLMYEIDYLKSAYREIASIMDKNKSENLFEEMFYKYKNEENVFDYLINKYSYSSKEELLLLYRNHYPKIELNEGVKEILEYCKTQNFRVGLITDGRSTTQRNKLKALGIEDVFNKIIISEEFGSTKPNQKNFEVFTEENINEYFYIADNPKKDFVTPNLLGWTTICLLDRGDNIHFQNFNSSHEYLPRIKIKNISELRDYF